MKTKPTRPPKRIRDLAERLFDIGIEGWRTVDNSKRPMKFKEIDNPAQMAGWYAIARYVHSVMKDPF